MKETILFRLRHFLFVFIPFWIAGLVLIAVTSKSELFLEINSVHSVFFDQFFRWETYLGNGVIFVAVIVIVFFKNKGWGILGLIIFIISAILPQVLKKIVFADVVRPVKYFEGSASLHLVDGVSHHLYHSFPSGHATSIVALCLFLGFIISEAKWNVLLAMIALITMYSRIYLAHHFLVDVLAGSILGIAAAWIGMAIYNKWIASSQSLKKGLITRKLNS